MRQAIGNESVRVRLRAWPLDDSVCHLVLLDVDMTPTTDHVDEWIDEAFAGDRPPRTIRTGALYPAAAEPFRQRGFVEIDRLALLERALDGRSPHRRRNRRPRDRDHSDVSLVRLRSRDLDIAASIDESAFDEGWRNSAASLADIACATPRARRRLAVRSRRVGVGFAITGRAGSTGYLQRLAVVPDARRDGVARRLVADAMDWLTRGGATRVLVNTGVTNCAALALYERAGFRRVDDELVVLEFDRAP